MLETRETRSYHERSSEYTLAVIDFENLIKGALAKAQDELGQLGRIDFNRLKSVLLNGNKGLVLLAIFADDFNRLTATEGGRSYFWAMVSNGIYIVRPQRISGGDIPLNPQQVDWMQKFKALQCRTWQYIIPPDQKIIRYVEARLWEILDYAVEVLLLIGTQQKQRVVVGSGDHEHVNSLIGLRRMGRQVAVASINEMVSSQYAENNIPIIDLRQQEVFYSEPIAIVGADFFDDITNKTD